MHLDLIYGYGYNYFENRREPFRKIEELLNNKEIALLIDEDEITHLKKKIENSCSKLIMAMCAGEKALDKEHNFIMTQNRECPALYGEDEIELVFYTESLILFSRASLDILSAFLGKILLEPFMKVRVDSFNKLLKNIYKIENESLTKFKELFDTENEGNFSWLKVLCGAEKGRSVRDQIVHQKNLTVYYSEYVDSSEKEKCFVECLDYKLPFDFFINNMKNSLLETIYQMEDFIVDDFKIIDKLKQEEASIK